MIPDYTSIANQYEVKSFIDSDPVQFCYRYTNKSDIEIAGIIAMWLSYGSRKVFLPKIDYMLLEVMKNDPRGYIAFNDWAQYKDNYSCLYRMTTWHNFYMLCCKLHAIYIRNEYLENALTSSLKKNQHYFEGLCNLLGGETMIPTSASFSANKRVNMFLRWMVRDNSPVDLGLWTTLNKKRLIVPCDTHSLASAKELGIISKVDETRRVAFKITEFAKEIFPNDPARLDFALYGYGINK